METRANYTLVGGFVLSFLAAILIFIVWIARFGSETNKTMYDIYFMGSVTGLDAGSVVRYRGVPVGTVKSVQIESKEGNQIRVTASIDKNIILRTDASASIETQGITGNTYVQIHGGTPGNPHLETPEGAPNPVIPSKSSRLEEVVNTVPAMVQQISKLAGDMRELFSEENRKNFNETLKNLRSMTALLTPSSHKKADLDDILRHLKTTLESLSSASTEIDQFIKENRTGIKEFTAGGLPAFTKFLHEGRDALSAIRRVAESIERSPSRFLYNDTKQGVRAP